jgi:hypothetical protein
MDNHLYKSERDIPLVYHYGPCDVPIFTVENYLKWYTLQVVRPDGSVCTPDDLDRGDEMEREAVRIVARYGESAEGNHVFNPRYVVTLAGLLGCVVCDESMEMIIGRWEREHMNKYSYTYEYDPADDVDVEKAPE